MCDDLTAIHCHGYIHFLQLVSRTFCCGVSFDIVSKVTDGGRFVNAKQSTNKEKGQLTLEFIKEWDKRLRK